MASLNPRTYLIRQLRQRHSELSTLSDAELNAVIDYTKNSTAFNHPSKPHHHALRTTLDGALQKLPPYQGKILYHFVPRGRDEASLKLGADYQAKSFLSASKAASAVGERGSKTEWVIHLRDTESRARDISAYSAYPSEQEVLYLPNTSFKVIKISAAVGGRRIFLEEI